MKKQIIKIIFSALTVVMLLPAYLLAAEAADSVKTNNRGKVTLISDHAEEDGITTLQFSLDVKTETEADVSMEFNDNISAKIMEYRYHADSNRLNIYIAGIETIFNGSESLNIGTVKAIDASGNNVNFNITVIEDSLKYVYETEAINSKLNGEPMIIVGDSNKDYVLDISDAAFIARKVAARKTNTLDVEFADYTGDNIADIRDAAAIARHIARREKNSIPSGSVKSESTVNNTKQIQIDDYQINNKNINTNLAKLIDLIKQKIA